MKIDALNEEITTALRFVNTPVHSSELKGVYYGHLAGLLKIKRNFIKSELKQSLEGGGLDNLDLIRKEAFKVAQSLIIDARDFDGASTDPSELSAGDAVKIEGVWMDRGYAEVIDRSYSDLDNAWWLVAKFYSEEEEANILLDGVRVILMSDRIDSSGAEQ